MNKSNLLLLMVAFIATASCAMENPLEEGKGSNDVQNVEQKQERHLTAACDDYLLAKACVAELYSSDFDGELELGSAESKDQLHSVDPTYGTAEGHKFFRGAVIGSVIGLVTTVTGLPPLI